jgi:hypothetical protein
MHRPECEGIKGTNRPTQNSIDALINFGGVGGKLQEFNYDLFLFKVLYLILCLASKKPKEFLSSSSSLFIYLFIFHIRYS